MKHLTGILIFLNPVGGLGLAASIITGNWFLVIPIVFAIVYNTRLYLKYNPPTPEQIKFEEENEYLGEGYYCSIYMDKKTGEIFEV